MERAHVYNKGKHLLTTNDRQEVVKVINQHKMFFLNNLGQYCNKEGMLAIIEGLTYEDRKWFASRIR